MFKLFLSTSDQLSVSSVLIMHVLQGEWRLVLLWVGAGAQLWQPPDPAQDWAWSGLLAQGNRDSKSLAFLGSTNYPTLPLPEKLITET